MSDEHISCRYEVTLSEQVLRDMATPGKIFQTELRGSGKEGERGAQSCILLDKINDNLVKLFVTVYKSDCAVETTKMTVGSQTDRAGVLDSLERSMQSESMVTKTMGQQTDHTQFQHTKCVQAEYDLATVDTQTVGVVPVAEQSVQVGVCQMNALVQTQSSMSLLRDGGVQTQSSMSLLRDGGVQTQSSMSLLRDGGVQTQSSMSLLRDGGVQTQSSMSLLRDGEVQTQSSMSLLRDGGVQATVSMAQVDCQTVILCEDRSLQTEVNTRAVLCQTIRAEKSESSQTEVNSAMKVTQTAMSMAWRKDQEVQAIANCVEMNAQTTISMALQADRDVQAVTEMVTGDSQTSVSMALESDKDVQATVTSADGDSQTHIDHIHRPCQTTVSMAHEEHKNVQASAETREGDSQTENSVTESSSQATVNSEEIDTQTPAMKPDEIPSSPSVSQQSRQTNSEVFTSPDILPYVDEPVKDEESQTDPVTIIIGDASILLEKLKGSTSNKITTSENEIEIEVHDVASLPRASVSRMSPTKKRTPRRGATPKYTRQSTSPRTLPTPQSAAAQAKRRDAVIMQDEVPFVLTPPVYGSSTDRGKYSCPFCTLTFHESPTLYEHLQNSHVEKCKSVKKPKGREGKTILYHEPVPSIVYSDQRPQEELDPPVLVPVVPLAENQAPEDGASEAYEMEPEPLDAYTTAVADSSRSNFEQVRGHQLEQAQHDVQKFPCSECGKIFDEATQLQTHLKVVHNINSIIEEVEVPNNNDEEVLQQPEPVSVPVKRKHSPVISPTKRRRNEDVDSDSRVTRSTPNTRSSTGPNHGTPLKAVASPPKQERQLRGVAAKK